MGENTYFSVMTFWYNACTLYAYLFILQEHGVNKIFKLEGDRLDAVCDKYVNEVWIVYKIKLMMSM